MVKIRDQDLKTLFLRSSLVCRRNTIYCDGNAKFAWSDLMAKISGRWPPKVAGVTFSDSDSALVPKNLNPGPGLEIFKFQNPVTIGPTEIYPCFFLRNGHTDSYYCRN